MDIARERRARSLSGGEWCGFVGLKTLRERSTGANVKKSKSKKLKSGPSLPGLTYIEHLSATTGSDPTGLPASEKIGGSSIAFESRVSSSARSTSTAIGRRFIGICWR